MHPKARTHKLTTLEMGDETLIYDRHRTQAHCLNRSAALVWRLCDGRTTIDEIARRIEQEVHVQEAKAIVQLALEQLERKHLLEKPVRKASLAAGIARRRALVKMGLVAGAMPVIMTLTARKARAAASQQAAGGGGGGGAGGGGGGGSAGGGAILLDAKADLLV